MTIFQRAVVATRTRIASLVEAIDRMLKQTEPAEPHVDPEEAARLARRAHRASRTPRYHHRQGEAVAGALITGEDHCLISYSPSTGQWSCTKRLHKKRPAASVWSGYVSPSETGMLVANRNGSVSVTSVAPPRPLRHFVLNKNGAAEQ